MNQPPPPLRLTLGAIEDARETRLYYHDIGEELATDFIAELREALRKVRDHPHLHGFYHKDARRCHLNRFPYLVLFRALEDETKVYAVAHEKQNPRGFIDRIES